ncbi:M48 family metalloprotease [Endozoicomonas arenosclerae]|uniref:M48 family metalloprotease n=1 Tax=Endozoicomonas arenosclerae TaxID=1633495 RepID=UPI000783538F|nr:M48 family metalloprotease [Endozoicomonas arenosclerae]
MKQPGFLMAALLSTWLGTSSAVVSAAPIELPSLGDTTSGIVSPQQEYELGQTYLKYLRSRTPTVSDPEVKEYLERLIYRLAEYSEIKDHRLNTLVIDSANLNAFAAPGGIIGVNSGLFFNADTEAQFAAVLAHELAHLSQRHYARNVEDAKNKSLPTAAAILASVILMATAGGDAGAAALSTTVAGIQSSRLRFSRQFEREADNIGIQTLAKAGFDPQAMPEIFENMNKSSRYQSRPPEFLLTHPVTDNRISDSRARAAQLPSNGSQGSLDYQLTRMRLFVLSAEDPAKYARQLKKELESGHTSSEDITRYGLALASLEARDYKTSESELSTLLKKHPRNLHLIMAQARLESATGKTDEALKRLDAALSIHLNNYPLIATKADILIQDKRFKEARDLLLNLSRSRPDDPDIWYELAEVQGQADDILGLHQARAEYFFLTGNLDDAIRHLQFARKMVGDNYALRAKIDKKLNDIFKYRQKLENS